MARIEIVYISDICELALNTIMGVYKIGDAIRIRTGESGKYALLYFIKQR